MEIIDEEYSMSRKNNLLLYLGRFSTTMWIHVKQFQTEFCVNIFTFLFPSVVTKLVVRCIIILNLIEEFQAIEEFQPWSRIVYITILMEYGSVLSKSKVHFVATID